MKIGNKTIGPLSPCFIIAEIGINHNGSIETAKRMIDTAVLAGADAVKFQKRTPEICTPRDIWDRVRETPWGEMTYIEYRNKLEFSEREYKAIDEYCKERDIDWFASPWDTPSLLFLETFNPVCHKIASAMATNLELLKEVRKCERPVILSTGGTTQNEIRQAVNVLDGVSLAIMQCTAAYPCNDKDLNLRSIKWLKNEFPGVPIGYSGHERGIATTVAAVVLGACLVERHITLDRSMWGSDQSASLEPYGFSRLVRDIRAVELAMGRVYKGMLDCEKPTMERLRWHERLS